MGVTMGAGVWLSVSAWCAASLVRVCVSVRVCSCGCHYTYCYKYNYK